jgi:hypothetical protein
VFTLVEDGRRTVYLTTEQNKLIKILFDQEFSKLARLLADALIKGANLEELPIDVAEAVIQYRILSNHRNNYEKELEILKQDFYSFLDQQNYPLVIARKSDKRARKAGRDFALKYYHTTQKLIPECHIFPFVNEYCKDAHYSGKVQRARMKLEEQEKKENTGRDNHD